MPIISYKVKGERFECQRDKLSECVEALVEAGRLPAGTDVAKIVNTGAQRIDYTKNILPDTKSNVERREKEGSTASAEATKI